MVDAEVFDGPGGARKVPAGAILGMGNPLLDISAVVPKSVLDKYDVAPGVAILAEEKHQPLYQELVDNYKVDYVAGGATQNSIRIAQWMSRSEGATTYVGSIGGDDFGKKLEEACSSAGVKPLYHISDKPTGVCGVCIVDKERSLITKLDAANEYKHSHTLTSDVQAAIEKAQIFYSASFFLTVPEGPQSVMHVAKHACENNKIFCMNLSAEFLIQFFREPMMNAIPYMDYVFGNEVEAKLFGEVNGWSSDLKEVALKLSALPKENGARPRVVVFSQGPEATIVACNGKVTLFPVPPLDPELLVDTNGAGDAFVGGFLARLAAGFDIDECVRAGHYSARVVIQRSGCTVPPQPDI